MMEMTKTKVTEQDTLVAVSRALWRMDKANPDLAIGDTERPWKSAKPEYVRRARILMKAFERDSLDITLSESEGDAT